MSAGKDQDHSKRSEYNFSERAFEKSGFAEAYWPMGFQHPKWNDGVDIGADLHGRLAALPDYMAWYGDGPMLVECKGAHGETVNALKVSFVEHLAAWTEFVEPDYEVAVFFWNSWNHQWQVVMASAIINRVYARGTLRYANDDKEYYPWSWTELRAISFAKGDGVWVEKGE